MRTNKKFYFYFFESGYRTGACRLTAKEIKELSEMISEEIDDAEKYIRHAIECKDTDYQS